MSRAIYKITVTNWEKYNGGMKRHYKASLIANNFCDDAKLKALPVTVRWMFLGILLTCGDHARDTVEMSESRLRDLLESSWSVPRAISSLQELQLLTFEKIEPFRIEKKRIEKKGKEVIGHLEKSLVPIKEISKTERNRPVRESYLAAYRRRYQQDPVFDAQNNSILSKIVDRIGAQDAARVVEFYVHHNSPFYASKCHALRFCLADLDSLLVQTNKGKALLRSDLKRFEDQTDSPMISPEEVAAILKPARKMIDAG